MKNLANARDKLLNEIQFKLSNKQILYATIEELACLKNKQDRLFKEFNFSKESNANEINTKLEQIILFLDNHAKVVGHKQAIKDLQIGLSLLNKNKRNSPINTKNILKDDGDYGLKTYACLCDVCKNYSVKSIKKYIELGAKNNIIFDTKGNSKIDTKKLINKVVKNLNEF